MSLPIESVLPELRRALRESTRVVLQAPPGAGKTTCVPLALLEEPWLSATGIPSPGGRTTPVSRKIILLEPRKLAARAAARRMAATLGESVGETVGFRVRGETRVSPRTRIEVVTEGVLGRMLVSDPALEEFGAVLLDEFHERSLHADFALALSLQSQEILRPDLRIVVMSATLDGQTLREFLDAELVTSEGRAFPVVMHYVPPRDGARVEESIARVVRMALDADRGSILSFLPGAGEIQRTRSILESGTLPADVSVIPLFGALDAREQDAAISAPLPGRRKVVLATSIAESSLTIDGVAIVVDGGLSRVPRFSPRTGMSHLTTVRVSRASATQRAGRAGRIGPGVCYRLWDQHEDLQLLERSRPEILEADLAALALDLAAAGVIDAAQLHWLDLPPAAALAQARALLVQLGAIDPSLRITAHGRALTALGVHPRLAHMLVASRDAGFGATACAIAALLGERDVLRRDDRHGDVDLRARVALCNSGRREAPSLGAPGVDRDALRRVRDEMKRLRESVRVERSELVDDTRTGEALAFAYPDRVARKRARDGHAYLMRNGSGAALANPGTLANDEFIVIADLDGRAGHARILLAAPIAQDALEAQFAPDITRDDVLEWNADAGVITAGRRESLGAMVLREAPSRAIDGERAADLLIAALRRGDGLALQWTASAAAVASRISFVRVTRPDWPDVSVEALLARADEWLRPHLVGVRKRSEVANLPITDLLLGILSWEQRRQLDELAPSHWTAPTGTRVAIDYSDPAAPSVRIRLQEVFGVRESPRINGVPLTFELLSPAQRPVQVTRDLAGFWRSSYFEVRKEMRGRYPKHHWPDDPLTADPTRRTRPR